MSRNTQNLSSARNKDGRLRRAMRVAQCAPPGFVQHRISRHMRGWHGSRLTSDGNLHLDIKKLRANA